MTRMGFSSLRSTLCLILILVRLVSAQPEAFKPEIIKVTENIFVAVNYAIANMIVIEGPDGLLVVDTTENQPIALQLMEQFRALTNNKTIKGIVITHNHADHLIGAAALLNKYQTAENPIEVYAHSTNVQQQNRIVSYFRVGRQFGIQSLTHDHGDGIGPHLNANANMYPIKAKPTITFNTRENFTCAGILFELLHIPGETSDQIAVWLPDKKVIMPGDNIYSAFPNIYAIRGTPSRNVKDWYQSIDLMRYLNPEFLVPSHTRPVSGKENVSSILTAYRDGIQYVHDQTLRLTEQDYFVDEIVEIVKLPPSLATHPYLIEYYGTVAWSVRHVFAFYVGWFSGDVVDLNPLTHREQSFRIKDLLLLDSDAKPVNKMIQSARQSIDKSQDNEDLTGLPLVKELQWALEVSSMALSIATTSEYNNSKAIKEEALRKLGDTQVSATGFNYYYSVEHEMRVGGNLPNVGARRARQEQNKDITFFMESFAHRLNPALCNESDTITIKFILTSQQQSTSFGYVTRHCVIEFQTDYVDQMGSFDAVVTADEEIWRSVVLNELTLEEVRPQLDVSGSFVSLQKFMAVVDPFYFPPKLEPTIPNSATSNIKGKHFYPLKIAFVIFFIMFK